MIKRVLPEDYFTKFFPKEPKNDNAADKIFEVLESLKKEIRNNRPVEPKMVYIPQPQPAREVATGSPENDYNEIPWGLIGVISVVGIIVIGIVAIAVRREK